MPTIYNKVVLDSTTLMDISDTTAIASDVASSKYFYLANGVKTQGTASSGSPTLQAKTNITPTTSSQTIEADSGYDGLSSVQINAIPSQYIVPTGNIAITSNTTGNNSIDISQYATATVAVSGGGNTPSATAHTIYLEFLDETNTTVPIYYNDSAVSSIITSSKPSTYNNKQVTLAQLDGTTWYSPEPIPLNTQLIDYTEMKDHYGLNYADGSEEEYEWSSVTDYISIDRNMIFSYVNYKWFGLYFYDVNKTYIRSFSPNDDGAVMDEYDRGHGTLDGGNIPPRAEYVRFVTQLGANDDSEASLIRIA